MWCNTHALPLNLICFQAHFLYLPQAHTFLQNDSESDLEKAIAECKKLIQLYQDKINAKIKSIWGNDSE